MKISEIKQKIQQLIDKAVNDNEAQKKLLNYLFRKLDEIKEIETMERLKEYEKGKYLKAYLLYKSIMRANYQTEHLNITNYDNSADYLKAIDSDIELLAKKEEKLPTFQPTSEQLLIRLGEQIACGEIKSDANHDYLYVVDEHFQKIITVVIETGKIKPDPAKELLEKHGLNK